MSLPSERVAIVATVDPDAYTASSYTSDYVDMEEWHQLMAVVMAGTIAASGTLDAAMLQATSSTGAGVKAITGKSITQMTTGDNDEQAIINLKSDELDVAGGFEFVAIKLTQATAAGDSAALLLGFDCRHGPADDFDLASVGEIVS